MSEHLAEPRRATPSGGSLREASQTTVGEVLGLLTHDLRNPLAALLSNVGFLQMVGEEMSTDAREAVGDLLLSVESLGRVIDALELVGHELQGRPVSQPSTLTVDSIVRSAKASLERAAESHGVTLKFDLGDHKGAKFFGVEQPFTMALSSLLHNSFTVAPAKSEVCLRVVVRGPCLVFRVLDSGPALSVEMKESVEQASSLSDFKSDRKARYSRGLGLYSVARAAHLAGAEFVIGEVDEATASSALELIVPLTRT